MICLNLFEKSDWEEISTQILLNNNVIMTNSKNNSYFCMS